MNLSSFSSSSFPKQSASEQKLFQSSENPINPLIPTKCHTLKIGDFGSGQNLDQQTYQKLLYFLSFFSPKDTAISLQKRNDNLQSLNFEGSSQEPDDIYNRRKRKVEELLNKEKIQIQQIIQIKNESKEKFDSIINFIKLFCEIKQTVPRSKNDYYSSKTFCALKNTSIQELERTNNVLTKMYDHSCFVKGQIQQSMQEERLHQKMEENSKYKNKFTEFLIIPRFLISREKIVRLSKDQELQENFEFLISNQCLGHYNNEANKKMPESKQMAYIRELMKENEGRERFAKICSINHGNKFQKKYGDAYYQLYDKDLEYLRYLDSELKKGKKYQNIKKQLVNQQFNIQSQIKSESVENESGSINGFLSFRSFTECLKKMEKSDKQHKMEQQWVSQHSQQIRKGLVKYPTMPDNQQKESEAKRSFMVKKSATMQSAKTKNIILIAPQSNEV